MSNRSKSPSWILLHGAAVVAVTCSLFSGLRIATLDKPALITIAELLPQGEVHTVHFVSAILLSLAAAGYLISRIPYFRNLSGISTPKPINYHRLVTWGGVSLLITSLLSGWMLFNGLGPLPWFRSIHFCSAIGLVFYIFMHGGVYLMQFGLRALPFILKPSLPKRQYLPLVSLSLGTFSLGFLLVGSWYLIHGYSHHPLAVAGISPNTIINIDGMASEPQWQQAQILTLRTDGGANFYKGRSDVQLKALQNGQEIFFHITWQDPNESLAHLPLKKTAEGWEILQSGYKIFDEKRHYEDKFAILLSENCSFAAAGTAHLGQSPLADKPANWHGKGYHYSTSEQVHDLWHWKAVRSNKMHLADDNFIGKPDKVRPGARRYTAGYQQDSKESGAYRMNWKWYSPTTITPKRLPAKIDQLAPYQYSLPHSQSPDWTISWFDYQPYSSSHDQFPLGTLMPSVLYTSNRFEGDRADVRARGIWRDGHWSLELVRKLDTGSSQDIPIVDGICMWVSAFDRAQIAHTRHSRAIQLSFDKTL
ncbi:ethylbenzene dehydrogenase-related protein [Microbulbifer sp. VTAC004]|uniref:ethylbenzene dehydrogenase-related protein n=1 Tax=Microbulbifer sp. VTAC004 TaxID=3243386 RepID=UPI004038FC4E